MKIIYIWLYLFMAIFISVPHVLAHDGTDELREFGKNKQKIVVLQKNTKDTDNKNEKLENLNSQINLLRRNILVLRNKLIEESPQIKSSMSKYDLDYMKELDFILKRSNRILEDTRLVLDE